MQRTIRRTELDWDHVTLLIKAGELLVQRGDYTRAAVVYRRAVGLLEEQQSSDSPLLARCLRLAGQASTLAEDYHGAIRLYERALAVVESGPDALMAAGLYTDVGTVLLHVGELHDAE